MTRDFQQHRAESEKMLKIETKHAINSQQQQKNSD
jgi:hypothetical protein